MTSKVVYHGELRTIATHINSGTTIETDAPLDNQGKGERFSPTDLVATALASCMFTLMGIAARTHNINVENMECEVEKVIVANPRKIGAVNIAVNFPAGQQYADKEKKILEHAALTCPVFLSLHEDVEKNVSFNWA
ncbi:MAG TPA: OsmC family protein [Flavipsychrobacter sp.]|nr:OsmC family protein [Flavipsychrobacter sp.]